MTLKLAQSLLFSGVDEKGLKLIEQAGQFVTAEKGSFLFFQDDPADRFYVVLAGKVKIGKTSAEGKEQILMMAGPGDSFGEAALFAKRIYPATAEAVEKSELVFFTHQKFMSLIKDNPAVAVNMIARLSMLLHHLTRLIQRISLEDVSTRLAGYILSLLPEDETEEDQTIILEEKKMFLASELGTIPETLSRAFARMADEGTISVTGQKITVHDRQRLAEIASGEKI